MKNNTVTKFANLVRYMCTIHKAINHSDKECHFSTNLDAAQNAFARKMHYPCVILDNGDFTYMSIGGADGKRRTVTILFVDHVKDTGKFDEIERVFVKMEGVCDDFMSMLSTLSKTRYAVFRFLSRFSLEGVEAQRITLESPALYGWAVTIDNADILCNDNENWKEEQGDFEKILQGENVARD